MANALSLFLNESELEGRDSCKESTVSSLVPVHRFKNKLRAFANFFQFRFIFLQTNILQLQRQQQEKPKEPGLVLNHEQVNADGCEEDKKLKEKREKLKQKLKRKHNREFPSVLDSVCEL